MDLGSRFVYFEQTSEEAKKFVEAVKINGTLILFVFELEWRG